MCQACVFLRWLGGGTQDKSSVYLAYESFFKPLAIVSTAVERATSVAVADLDGDRVRDIVVAYTPPGARSSIAWFPNRLAQRSQSDTFSEWGPPQQVPADLEQACAWLC